MKKTERKYLVIAILINVGIVGGVALFVVAGIYNIIGLVWAAFAFLGIIGILCSLLTAFININDASSSEKEHAKKQLSYAKEMLLNMEKSELLTFIIVFIIVVALFIAIIIFSVMHNFTAMFISIGLFIGFGLISAFYTINKQKRNDRKIKKSRFSKEIMSIVITCELFSNINGKIKYRYTFLISGDNFYAISEKKLTEGTSTLILTNKKVANHCVIL